MRKKPTPNELETRICPVCNEGHTKDKKWIYTPNKFLPFDLPDGTPVCMKHYATEHSKWRFQTKIKNNQKYTKQRRARDNKRYAEDNEYRSKILDIRKKERDENKEEIKDAKKAYSRTERAKEANRVRNKRYYDSDKEKQKQRIKSLAIHPTRQFTYLKRRAKVADIPLSISLEDFIEIRSANKCYYCHKELTLTAPSIDRLDSSRGYYKENCVPCCLRCNTIKRDLLVPEELLLFHTILRGEIEIPQVTKQYSLHNVTKCSSARKRWGRLIKASKDKNINLEINFEQYKKLLSEPCAYCGTKNIGTGYGLDKKVPDKDIGYTLANAVSCCTPCNQIKSNFLTYTEMKILMVVVAYHRLK